MNVPSSTVPSKTSSEASTTPMLRQYQALKAKHPGSILFYRLGDFYEMFFEDAKIGSKVLDLVLTARGKGSANRVPMCGVPHHSAENYIARLIKAGHKVAICEQVEDPATAQGIVKRDVIRTITSGTYLDENSTASRYIFALSPDSKHMGISFIDPAIGQVQTNQFPLNQHRLIELLTKLPVYECIYPESKEEIIQEIFKNPLLQSKTITLSPCDDWTFSLDMAKQTLLNHFHVKNLNGFGIEDRNSAISSTGALIEYLKAMNKQPLQHVDKLSLYTSENFVYISPAAYHGLELHTLIKTLDETLTPLGRRLFSYWYLHPLKKENSIKQRQEATKHLKDHTEIQQQLKECLDQIPDIEKNISRLSCGYTHAKDLLAIRNTLNLLPKINDVIKPLKGSNSLFQLDDIPELRKFLLETINEDIPLSKPEGKVIKKGYDKELDELRAIQETGQGWLKSLQAEEIKRSGINSLKIGFNRVFGYYIEVTKLHSKNVPADFIRKQTLVNAERYITPKLKEYEEKILTAQDKILKIEHRIIQEIQKRILDHSIELHKFCHNIATIDCIYSFTVLAQSHNYVCPHIHEDALLDIKAGRHPFVERTTTETFVANDTLLDSNDDHLVILTGPNMAGKSTYIRQTAILTIMAQVGSFIPAQSAHIGIVDKIFTRIGAHDDISKGQSTFMVEMNETADILNNFTDRSLIILDEIGRGTSTYDGLSLAWALAEHFSHTKARTLFATHFHELTVLAEKHPGVKNYNVAVKEWKDEIIFLHKIVPGSTDDSYGIYVAKLAGIPHNIINRAKEILTQLELKSDVKNQIDTKPSSEDQLNLFSPAPDPVAAKMREAIEALDVNEMTPVEVVNWVVTWQKEINKNR